MSDLLPPFKSMPINPKASLGKNNLDTIVIHKTIGDKDSGADAAALCVARSNAPGAHGEPGVWTWTVGFDGSVYKHAEFDAYLSHAGGINHLGPGIEHDLGSNDEPSEAMLNSSARIVATYCVLTKRPPSRNWIIGHIEDNLSTRYGEEGTHWTRWGGDSSHTDPEPAWPWSDYMQRITDLLEGEDMTKEESLNLKQVRAVFIGAAKQLGLDPAKPGTWEKVGRALVKEGK